MIKSNFLKEAPSAATFLQVFNDFQAKLEPLENKFTSSRFQSISQSI